MQTRSILTRIEPQYKNCPSCHQAGSVYRSHSRNLLEKLFRFFKVFNIYRCHKCNWRGYLATYSFNFAALQMITIKNIAIYVVLVITCAVFVVAVIKAFAGKN